MSVTHKAKAGALLTGTEYEAADSHDVSLDPSDVGLGATPGGELGGTWASPTVDATHAGSTHLALGSTGSTAAAGNHTHSDSVTSVAATGSTETVTWSATTQTYDLTLDQACTFTLAGATNGVASYLTIILRGAFATTWPGSVTWLNGAPPIVALRTVTLFTIDGGTTWYGTSSRSAAPAYAINRYTTGDITLGSGSTPVAVSGPSDLVVAAASGDLLMVGLSARSTDTDADSLSFDFATIVSGSAVNFVSSLTGTPATTGVPGWYLGVSRVESCHGEHPYVVQSGDVSGGNVTLRLYYRVSGTGKVLAASTGIPLEYWVRNLKQ